MIIMRSRRNNIFGVLLFLLLFFPAGLFVIMNLCTNNKAPLSSKPNFVNLHFGAEAFTSDCCRIEEVSRVNTRVYNTEYNQAHDFIEHDRDSFCCKYILFLFNCNPAAFNSRLLAMKRHLPLIVISSALSASQNSDIGSHLRLFPSKHSHNDSIRESLGSVILLI